MFSYATLKEDFKDVAFLFNTMPKLTIPADASRISLIGRSNPVVGNWLTPRTEGIVGNGFTPGVGVGVGDGSGLSFSAPIMMTFSLPLLSITTSAFAFPVLIR